MSKPINPYTRLVEEVRDWARGVVYPRQRAMFFFAKGAPQNGWRLDGVVERVQAADTLGWDVVLEVDKDGGLWMKYRERPGIPPWQVAP